MNSVLLKKISFICLILLGVVSDMISQDYTLEFDSIPYLVAGKETTIRIHAAHPEGINQVQLIIDNDYTNKSVKLCNGDTSCTLYFSFTLDNPGKKLFSILLYKEPLVYVTETDTIVDFICDKEYCSPDSIFIAFFCWMRTKGYDECVTAQYIKYSLDGILRSGLRSSIFKKSGSTDREMSIDFYDIIPLDSNSTYISLGQGEGGDCVNLPDWPDHCPSPVPADYLFIQNHFTRTFGIDFTFNYHRVEVNYEDTMGKALPRNTQLQFPIAGRNAFRAQYPGKCIIHYAIETLRDSSVYDMTGGATKAEISYEPAKSYAVYIYTHEWGHTIGGKHSFVTYKNNRYFFSTDGIMDNTYRQKTIVPDLLDPIERYIFEPDKGYIDDSLFASVYSDLIVQTDRIESCGQFDPAITKVEETRRTNDSIFLTVTMVNNGVMSSGYVPLIVYDRILPGDTVSDRTLEYLPSDSTIEMEYSLSFSDINSDTLFFCIDPDNIITESDENNNSIAFIISQNTYISSYTEQELIITPNPSSTNFNFIVPDGKYTLTINDLNGRAVKIKEDINGKNLTISSNGMPKGIYIYMLRNIVTGKVMQGKLMVK